MEDGKWEMEDGEWGVGNGEENVLRSELVNS